MTAPEVRPGVLQSLHGRVTVGWQIYYRRLGTSAWTRGGHWRTKKLARAWTLDKELPEMESRIVRLYRRVRWVKP